MAEPTEMEMTTTAHEDTLPKPRAFLSSIMQIEPQWIDYNGHLNMAYYNVMFDRAIDELWLKLGIGPAYMKERHGSTFTAECHVRYLREIHLGDPVQISILLVGADEKRLHTFEELRHAGEGCAQDRAVSTRHPRAHRSGSACACGDPAARGDRTQGRDAGQARGMMICPASGPKLASRFGGQRSAHPAKLVAPI
jgi:acyl-CoA thioesterase FadM